LKIEEQQLRQVLDNNFSSLIGNIGVAAMITLTLNSLIEDNGIFYWFAFILLAVFFRAWFSTSIKNRLAFVPYSSKFETWFFYPIILNGLAWASLVIFFMDENEPIVNAFIMITIAGIASGSMSTLISVKKYYFSFVFVVVGPVIVSLLLMEATEYNIFAIMVLFFIFFMLKNGAVFNQELTSNLRLITNNEALIQDLKNEKDKAIELSELKSQFLANMSHEIRTPLNAITGFIKILKDQEKDKTKLNYLSTLSDSSNDLISIVDEILDFSKLEKNQIVIEKIKIDPISEIKQSIEFFRTNAERKQIEIELNLLNSIPKTIISDPLRIRQVLNNLLSNAIKFSAIDSQVKVNVEYFNADQMLKVSVIDNGIGIPNNKLKHIFDSFTQADNSSTRQYGGTGLGLAISSNLTALLGGEINVDSTLGVGSTFTFSIAAPAIKIDDAETKVDTSEKKLLTDKQILIVEDNLVNQKLLGTILSQMGINFDIAEDGAIAVEAFKKNKYHVILMDENMPNMTGIEATKAIREIEQSENLEATPIIAVTANALEGDRDRFLAAGMDEYLSKPVQIDKFKNLIMHFLS
jgi:signal transduction histidine kinase/CheY-like chemotaxis protein